MKEDQEKTQWEETRDVPIDEVGSWGGRERLQLEGEGP